MYAGLAQAAAIAVLLLLIGCNLNVALIVGRRPGSKLHRLVPTAVSACCVQRKVSTTQVLNQLRNDSDSEPSAQPCECSLCIH